jgi:hypothetical protein
MHRSDQSLWENRDDLLNQGLLVNPCHSMQKEG